MVLERIRCPHCHVTRDMDSEGYAAADGHWGHFLFLCPQCFMPVVLCALAHSPKPEFKKIFEVSKAYQSFEKCGWRIVDSWPKPLFRPEQVPVGVPEPIAALFENSRNAARAGCFDLAIMGFHRVLKMTQATISPESSEKPHAWILSRIKAGKLTVEMAKWAERLRGLRSEVQDANVNQAEDFAVFVEVLLELTFGIRSKMRHGPLSQT